MSFEALIADLDALQKARAPVGEPLLDGDDKIQAAADPKDKDKAAGMVAEGEAAAHPEPDGDESQPPAEGEGEGEGEEEGEDDEILGKSMRVTLPDGTESEAYDGTAALLKAITAIREEQAARLALVAEVAALSENVVLKSDVMEVLKRQGALLKSLSEQIAAMGKEGRPRKSVLNVHEKQPATPAAPAAPSTEDLLAKAQLANQEGRMTAYDVARLQAYTQRGLQPPDELIKAL